MKGSDKSSPVMLTVTPTSALQVAKPSISPASKTITGQTLVTITSSTQGATIYYTDNGTLPNSNSKSYQGPFLIDSSLNIKAIAVKTGYQNSEVASEVYTMQATKVANPVFSSADGTTFTSSLSVTISCSTTGSTVYYSTNGSAPNQKYTGPFTVSATTTIKAQAKKDDFDNSDVVTVIYQRKCYGTNCGKTFAKSCKCYFYHDTKSNCFL